MYFTPSYMPCGYRDNNIPKTYKTIDEALALVKQAVQGERADELFYDYLLSEAPTREEKDIIASIRDDEIKHNKLFREIYLYFTNQNVTAPSTVDFTKPKSYIEGIKKAKFGELAAMEKYRNIHAGFEYDYFRDIVFEILTDELKHAHKYDYILYLNLENRLYRNDEADFDRLPVKTHFTTDEARQISNALRINFNKEKFNLEQFRMGLNTELEHGRRSPSTNVTNDNPIVTGKIALAHLREFPDYYTRLSKLEEEAKAYWAKKS